jgi:hypothetical protein
MYLRLVRGASRRASAANVAALAAPRPITPTSEVARSMALDRAGEPEKPHDDFDLSDWPTPSMTSHPGDPFR